MSKGRRRREETLNRQAVQLTIDSDGESTTMRAAFCPLCGRFVLENSWGVMSMEDAPPKQYGNPRERCLTCKACNNGSGGSFEARVHEFNVERAAAIRRASQPNPLFTSPGEALRLATVSPDEKLLEIKSSYIIAFVTLGLTYASGPGLDQVRELIAGGTLGNVSTCATLPASQVSDGDWVFVARDPVECVVVTHPTRHSRRPGVRHVVFLPMPNSEPGFYARVSLLLNRTSWRFTEQYAQPETRRMPRYWDRNGSEHGYGGDREIEVGILEALESSAPFAGADPSGA
jgi:hypothetical protein